MPRPTNGASAPEKIKAAILVEQRKPLIIAEINTPKELAVGQVLVKIHFSGIQKLEIIS